MNVLSPALGARAYASYILVLGFSIGSPHLAHAHAMPPDSNWIMVGPILGYIPSKFPDSGAIAGIDASYVHVRSDGNFERPIWFGAYIDAGKSIHGSRWVLGPEFGYVPFGIDLGGVYASGEDGAGGGVSCRLSFSLVALQFYFRESYAWFSDGEHRIQESGVLLKIPFNVNNSRRFVGN